MDFGSRRQPGASSEAAMELTLGAALRPEPEVDAAFKTHFPASLSASEAKALAVV